MDLNHFLAQDSHTFDQTPDGRRGLTPYPDLPADFSSMSPEDKKAWALPLLAEHIRNRRFAQQAALIAAYIEAHSDDRRVPLMQWHVAQALATQGEYAQAIEWIDRISASDPAGLGKEYILATKYFLMGDQKKFQEVVEAIRPETYNYETMLRLKAGMENYESYAIAYNLR